ncbi:ATP-binding protein [Streptomyces sp. NPDC101118]|uniref:ATP-binding protein n=1 Tax=Streptomyces sp. NPDC101118 TaxID=3366109 RepID=UPI0037F4D9CE
MQTIGPGTSGEPAPDERDLTLCQRRILLLRGARRQVTRGREFARAALADWGWDAGEAAEDTLLVVSELVTNASLHAGGCHELVLSAGEVFRVEVYDGLPDLPQLQPAPRRGVPGGHGLHIVRRLSDRWGAEAHADGKVVWAEFEAERLRTGASRGW